jgi:hypothetical protein
VIEHQFLFDRSFFALAPATQGIVSLELLGGVSMPKPPIPGCGGCDTELDILLAPDPSQPPQILSVPGLTVGLLVRWVYEYRFIGLRY